MCQNLVTENLKFQRKFWDTSLAIRHLQQPIGLRRSFGDCLAFFAIHGNINAEVLHQLIHQALVDRTRVIGKG